MPGFDALTVIQRLTAQFSRGHVILFTGAGFSMGAADHYGRPIPQVKALRDEIWELIWPDESIPEDATLKSTYHAALMEARGRLGQLLSDRLTVDPESVTESHQTWLSMPWRRAYTLNIDDLEAAASRKFELPRRIDTFSALSGRLPLGLRDLVYVHLNGSLEDVPDVTFTDPQYGLRHQATNALYEQLAADLLSYTVVFVGTELNESLFWEYVALRDDRGPRGVREGRPISYLVTPTLARDRQRMLDTYHIEWIPARHDEFAEEVLSKLGDAVAEGVATLTKTSAAATSGVVHLPYVAELAALPRPPASDYLLGSRPSWDDIQSGRAITRAFEEDIDFEPKSGCLVVTGTAGAGTSTTLMRIALRMVERGRDVRWLGADHAFDARELSRALRRHKEDIVVVIDDADTFGRPLMELVSDALHYDNVLLVVGMRASRVDRILTRWAPDQVYAREINVPLLEDRDIEALLQTLETDNKLGALRQLSSSQRIDRIRRECNRELLVAMIEATSGEKFEVKATSEYEELEPEQKLIYGVVALASELRFSVHKDEILMASEDLSNTALHALERLTARRLILVDGVGYTLRHRRIAELVVASMRSSRQIVAPYRGLLRTFGARYDRLDREARETKLFGALLSHSLIARSFNLDDARTLYADIEELAKDDYHYWLQRGSLEVQQPGGNLALAANWLQQARADGPHDHRVQTEWAYYLLKSAWKAPLRADASEKVAEGRAILLDQISARGSSDSHCWHVYGSQMLGWLRAATLPEDERRTELQTLNRHMEDAVAAHPGSRGLRDLARDVKQEWLLTATR